MAEYKRSIKPVLPTVFLLLLSTPSLANSFGPAFSTGPVDSGNFIREAISTLVVPDAPNPVVGNTVLWTGMGTSNGDLIQGINNNYPPDNQGDPCSELSGDWCVAAYTLQAGSGPRAVSAPGDTVTMHYVYNDSTQLYDQTVSINGNIVSTISSNSGLAQGWGTAVECTTNPCGTVPAHTWINTVITLDQPYADYINTNGKSSGVTGQMETSDSGQTWTVSQIGISQSFFSTD